MVVMLYTEKETFVFGSTQQLNQLVGNSVDMVPTIKVSVTVALICCQIENFDDDKDGKNEEIDVKISLVGIKEIRSVFIIQSLKWAISKEVHA